MNYLTTETRDLLVEEPSIAFEIAIPEPQQLKLHPYAISALPGIVAELTKIPIQYVKPQYIMGRVTSYNALPAEKPDPIIIRSQVGDLRPYYKVWARVVKNGVWKDAFFNRPILRAFDNAIRHFIWSASSQEKYPITQDECIFAVCEMLKFKNSNIFQRNEEPVRRRL